MDEPEKKPEPQITEQAQAGIETGVKPAENSAGQAAQPAPAEAGSGAVESPKPETKSRPQPAVSVMDEEEVLELLIKYKSPGFSDQHGRRGRRYNNRRRSP